MDRTASGAEQVDQRGADAGDQRVAGGQHHRPSPAQLVQQPGQCRSSGLGQVRRSARAARRRGPDRGGAGRRAGPRRAAISARAASRQPGPAAGRDPDDRPARITQATLRRPPGLRPANDSRRVGGSATATGEESREDPERSRHCEPGRAAIGAGSQDVRVPPPAPVAVTRPDCGRGHPHEREPATDPMRTFPFTAVVGSDDMALALVLTTDLARGRRRAGARREGHREVDHRAGAGRPAAAGRRRRRAAASPATRPTPTRPARTARTPRRRRRARRPARLVELPVGATEDRVLGSLHLERALTEGSGRVRARPARRRAPRDPLRRRGQPAARPPGRPAARRRRDGPLDRRARGVSVEHAARFVLVGTMNPEEGELRPQLLDRFGLTVEVAAPRDPALRVEVVRRRLAYDADPAAFAAPVTPTPRTRSAERIAAAQALLRSGACSATARCPRSPRCARPSRSTACAPTSSPPGPRSRTPPGTAATVGDQGGRPGRRPARAAAPPPPQPVRRARPRRGAARPDRSGTTTSNPSPSRRPEPPDRSPRTTAPATRRRTAPTGRHDRPSGRVTDQTARTRPDCSRPGRRRIQPARATRPARRRRDAPRSRGSRSGPGCSRCRGIGDGAAGPARPGDHQRRADRRRRTARDRRRRLHLPATVRAAAPHQRAPRPQRAPAAGLAATTCGRR